jgi:hypothetical protein
MYKGIFGSYDPMTFDCPSGNCKWGTFESIGICNKCIDVTAQTNASMWCENGLAPWDNSTLINRTCSYETPSGYRLKGNARNWDYNRRFEKHHTLWNSTTYWDNFNRTNYTQPDPGLATIAALKWVEYDDTVVSKPEIWLESAYECRLTWCAKEYNNTHAASGTLTDDPTKNSRLYSMESAECKFNATANSTLGPMAFSASGNNISKFVIPAYKDGDVPFPLCWTDGEGYEELMGDPKAFWLNGQDNSNVRQAIDAIFTTTFESISRAGDDPGRALYRTNNFTQSMENLARSLTNRIRMGPNKTDIHGIVQLAEQHIHVHWEWMILPISLVLFSMSFLAVSMTYRTAGSRGVWKSSALPSLYHGLPGWEASQVMSTNLEDMERRAKGMSAILSEDLDGSLKLIRSKNGN